MEGWGRQGDNFYQEGVRTRPPYKKPPLGNWQQTVPSWEKKFCTSVGSIPWRKILETKKCMHLYDNVVKWNDSAGAEAFQNAKNRFYANFHGLPCDTSLPDPNIYIDEIDWDSKIDPDLIMDLESRSVAPEVETKEKVIIFGHALIANQGFSSTGWGDNEDDVKKTTNSTSENNVVPWDSNEGQNNCPTEGNGWGDYGYNNNNTWCWPDTNSPKVDSGWNNEWGYGWNNSWGCNQYGNNNYVVDDVNGGNGGGWGNVNNGRREGSARYMSRYKTSRFHGYDNQRNHYSWRNGNGNEWKPKNMNTMMVPASHHASGQVRHQWS